MQNVLKSYTCFNFWLVQNVSIEKHVHCVHDGQQFTCFNWMLPSAINMLTKNTHPQKQHNFRIISWQLLLCNAVSVECNLIVYCKLPTVFYTRTLFRNSTVLHQNWFFLLCHNAQNCLKITGIKQGDFKICKNCIWWF